jgi:hypothetical protein
LNDEKQRRSRDEGALCQTRQRLRLAVSESMFGIGRRERRSYRDKVQRRRKEIQRRIRERREDRDRPRREIRKSLDRYQK